MLPRIPRLPVGTSRRAYSFFSSKPGGGRYFNSAKPHKVAPASATAPTATQGKAKPDDGSPSSPPPTSPPPEDVAPKRMTEADSPPAMCQQPALDSGPTAPRLPPHPTFSSHTYPLHQFFSLHRPLLLLPLPTSTLFDTSQRSFDENTSPPLVDAVVLQSDEPTESSADADADAARQLARALALNRIGGWIDWEEALARLGDAESIRALRDSVSVLKLNAGVSMDSTRRKRRKKMSKHKYKKRRRLQRAERRKMGK